MFKKVTYSMAIFCMICSSIMASLNAECPCKRRKAKVATPHQTIVLEVEQTQSETIN